MKKADPKTIYLKDYTPPPFLIDRVDLRFELGEQDTRVFSTMAMRRNPEAVDPKAALWLDGEALELLGVSLNGEALSAERYRVDEEGLALAELPDQFELAIQTRIHPQDNTSLNGLYLSSGNFCTQCEAQGFRRITYFLDRPDVMATYTTTVVAHKTRYPVLLSNGNPVDEGELEDGRHWVTWEDPHKKPSYLFALVAGDLAYQEDWHATPSGRSVVLRIYVQEHNIEKCDHAMVSLKKAMRWDEERFGREYDLDIYMIVAVDDFNMGAMENKGLNVFNSKYVLALPETATDMDYIGIEAVIGHEYFHNWTGNRITCRDWFQLSLKEGLTVFRDQEFTADMNSAAVKRIEDVRRLRTYQFAQDSGPMAHPVRPDAYIEINNFYTVTVYEKGAEVVRMYQTLLGREGFRRGMDLYFERHDGQAVTVEAFRDAMAQANDVDLTLLQRWYEQAGTPELDVKGHWDEATQRFELTIEQDCAPTPGQKTKQPFLIPFALGLLDAQGHDLPLRLKGEAEAVQGTRVLQLSERQHRFEFVDIAQRPVPSLLRGFSAPVKLNYEQSEQALMFLMAHDNDSFNRWEAGQRLVIHAMDDLLREYHHAHALGLSMDFLDAFRAALSDEQADPALIADTLSLPSEAYLAELFEPVDPEAIYQVRQFLRRTLASALRDVFTERYEALSDTGPYSADAVAIGRRSLKNLCLGYLMCLDDDSERERCFIQFQQSNNMTDTLAALAALTRVDCPERREALALFETRWQHDTLVMDKWFSLQALSPLPQTLDEVKHLMGHALFSIRNPNKVRALIGAFTQNALRFHAEDGAGYAFVAKRVVELDQLNPQIASRICASLSRWRQYEPGRRALMRAQLAYLNAQEGLSKDVFEIVSKSLSDE